MSRKERGFSLLEMLLAVPVTVVFLLGVMQTAHVLQAKNALHKGLETALRCLYPVNGKCVQAAAAPASALYDWYQVSGNNKYSVARYRYRGLGLWFETPRYTYEAAATIPHSVTSFYTQTSYAAKRVLYAVNGELDYWLLTARSPYARGGNINDSISFRYPKTTNTLYPVFDSFDISNVTLSPSKTTKNVTFTVPRPWGNSAPVIFKASDLNTARNAHIPDFAHDVTGSYADRAHVKIWITGEGHGRVPGKVELWLSWDGGDIDLGGRTFTGAGTWNFVPRGFPENGQDGGTKYFDNALFIDNRGLEYNEWTLYDDDMVKVPYDKPIRLTLRFVTSGNASWSGRSIRIYTPLFEHKSALTQKCAAVSRAEFMRNGGESAKQACRITPPEARHSYAASSASIDATVNIDTSLPITLGCNLSLSDAARILPGRVSDAESYDLFADGNACVPYAVNAPCPHFGRTLRGGAPNFGIAERADHAGLIVNASAAAAVCPVVADSQTAGLTPITSQWREKTVTVPDPVAPESPFRFSWNKTACNLAPALPAPLSLVPAGKLTLRVSNMIRETLFTAARDPRQMKKDFPALYDCAEIQLAQKIFGGEQVPPAPAGSLFSGVKQDLGERCYENLLREDAFNNGLNRNAFFTATPDPQYVDSVLLDSPPAGMCGVRFQLQASLKSETKIASALAEGQKPAACSESPCRAELAGYAPGNITGPRFDFAQARQTGLEALQALYPNATVCTVYDGNCDITGSGAPHDCVDLCFQTVTSKAQTSFKGYAFARVPLAFHNSADISAQSEEPSELNYAR